MAHRGFRLLLMGRLNPEPVGRFQSPSSPLSISSQLQNSLLKISQALMTAFAGTMERVEGILDSDSLVLRHMVKKLVLSFVHMVK